MATKTLIQLHDEVDMILSMPLIQLHDEHHWHLSLCHSWYDFKYVYHINVAWKNKLIVVSLFSLNPKKRKSKSSMLVG